MISGDIEEAEDFGNRNLGTIGSDNYYVYSPRHHQAVQASDTAAPHKPSAPPTPKPARKEGVVPEVVESQSSPLPSEIVNGQAHLMRNTSGKLLYAGLDIKHKKVPGVVSSHDAEEWIFTRVVNNQYTIQSSSSHLYMALDKDSNLQMLSASQAWDIRPEPDADGVKIYAPHRNDRVLKVSRSNVKFDKVIAGRGDDIWEVENI